MVVLTLGPLELRRRERTEGAAVFSSSQIGIGRPIPAAQRLNRPGFPEEPRICSHPAATYRAATRRSPSMIALSPLCTMTVRLKEPLDAGNTPTGQRVIASASLSGRLSGSLAGGSSGLAHDGPRRAWASRRAHCHQDRGRRAGSDALCRADTVRARQASIVMIAPVFETGDPRYSWLNEIQAVGKGILSADLTTLDYEICELQ
jgi:Protein of unknown function (DUF3237)